MPGGLIQLIAYGAQNQFINGNPRMSFFKRVFRAHTHFSMESFTLQFSNEAQLTVGKSTIVSCKIRRFGDMLYNTYVIIELPDVDTSLSGNEYYFKWIENIGELIVEEYWVSIGGSVVERRTGEFQHIWNELSISDTKRSGYQRLNGYDKNMFNPPGCDTQNINPSYKIMGRRIWIPLQLWFSRDSGLALPLIALQLHDVELYVRFRRLDDLYMVRHKSQTTFTRPSVSQLNILDKIVPKSQHTKFAINNGSLNILARVDANYAFLADKERNFFAKTSVDYLIEEVQTQTFSTQGTNNIFKLTINNLVKEIIWFFRPKKAVDKNDWVGFVDASGKDFMYDAKLTVQGIDRFETKTSDYFNLIQPYHHHTRVPKAGIYVYSFSILPELFQPSGTINASRLSKFQLITTNDASQEYDVICYYVNYNFLRIIGGMGSLMWQT